jgi:formylglycine-generating enzyme required for sulfatase activity
VRLGEELELSLVELRKADRLAHLPPALRAWVTLFEHWQEEQRMSEITDEPVRRAYEKLKTLSQDAEARRLAFVRERALHDEATLLLEAREDGLEEGHAAAMREAAANMIQRTALDDAAIAAITGLDCRGHRRAATARLSRRGRAPWSAVKRLSFRCATPWAKTACGGVPWAGLPCACARLARGDLARREIPCPACRRTVLAAAALPALLWAPVAGAQQPSAAEQSDPTLPPEPCMSRPGQGPEMVLIEGGTFLTGSPEGDDEAGPGALRRCSAGMWVCWTSMT